MTLILPLLLLLILAACVGFTFAEGLWSNAIRLINVVTAGLLAMNFFEPLARWIESLGDLFASFTYFLDFISLWGLFFVFMLVFRQLTSMVSRVKVRFMSIVDRIGSVVLSLVVGWVMVAFTLTTLHTAPLAEKFLFGAFDYQSTMFLVGPDRQWIVFFTSLSRGSFSRTLAEGQYGEYGASASDPVAEFDRGKKFMTNYALRRAALESAAESSGSPRVNAGSTPKR